METLDITKYEDKTTRELELRFGIASARARGVELLCVIHGEEKRISEPTRRYMRLCKKQGRAQCFLAGEKMQSSDSVARYMAELFPEECDKTPDASFAFLYF